MSAISPSTGRTLPDRYFEGTCPICGYDGARGDQCDNCGNQLDPIDLINPRSKINGETPTFVETEHFFLDLPALAAALGDWLNSRSDWRPNVLKFSLNLLADLKPRAMTRDIDWGIPVPLDGWRDRPDKKLYVWFDAVIGYLSAAIEWARRYGSDPEQWRHWWCNPDARQFYFMGKDNITFHSQIWPAELLAYDGKGEKGGAPGSFGELQLPTEVVSSEFLTMSGSKFSTSRGTVIYVGDFLREFGPDALRYFISVAGPETQDVDFTWEEFVRRTNFELANEWGNLVNRSISMAHKNFGSVPAAEAPADIDAELLAASERAFTTVGDLLARSRFKAAAGEAMRVVSLANKYLSDTAPWKLGDDKQRQGTVLHTALQVVDDAKTLLTPFLPHSSQQVFAALGGEGVWAAQPEIRSVTDFDDDVEGVGVPPVRDYPVLSGNYAAQQAVWRRIPVPAGRPLAKPTPLFGKLDPALGETGPDWAPIG
jgi:methionyl-tRNA synthetase